MRSAILLTTNLLLVSSASLAIAQGFPTPRPTEAHAVLAKEAGTWDGKVKMFFAGPDGPVAEFTAVETNTLVNNGLHVRTEFTMKMGETTFEGHGLTGWDPKSKTYLGTWTDTFTTTPVRSTGTYDAKTKTFTVESSVVDEAGNEVEQLQTTKFTDADTKVFTIFHMTDGKRMKLMEMTAKRRAKKG